MRLLVTGFLMFGEVSGKQLNKVYTGVFKKTSAADDLLEQTIYS